MKIVTFGVEKVTSNRTNYYLWYVMEQTKIKTLCPICGQEIDKLSDLDTVKMFFPNRNLICLSEDYAHYTISGKGHYLTEYKRQINFLYNLYLGVN